MQKSTHSTYKIVVNGRVQGVGFRPFVYHIATQLSLRGTVSNNENGVVVYINADIDTASQFLEILKTKKPTVSEITETSITAVVHKAYKDFRIVLSENQHQIKIPLTPDFAVCNQCKSEISDPENRRFNYAFTTCVHCGPRYAVTQKYPFERHYTSVSKFEMCRECREEYETPTNRRFHSQTNSCPTCGIILKFVDAKGKEIIENQWEIIKEVAAVIRQGKIVALKNTNGYLLCCDAANSEAIIRLREKKQRPSKPFAVLYPNMAAIEKEFQVSPAEKEALQSTVAPIVILENSEHISIASNAIAPRIHQTGVMLPSSALLQLVVNELQYPIVSTSGNLHGSPIISTAENAQKVLGKVTDYIVHHNLDIEFPQDDSVLRFVGDIPIVLRRSRGMAPSFLQFSLKNDETVLSMGSHLKSTFTWVPNGHIYTSQYFGNLDSYEVSQRYENTIKRYFELFSAEPKSILVDAHPQYRSTILGNEISEVFKAQIVSIQHHKAHFASVLGEHGLFNSGEKILGVVWDGTGLGDDQEIWGGEFFVYQYQTMDRFMHFEYFDWIARDKMAKEPRLSLLSLLDEADRKHIRNKFSATEWKVYNKMLASNTLKTSSVGRLFDAVASVLDLADHNSYEAEAGLLLENCASQYLEDDYLDFLEGETMLSSKAVVKNILEAKSTGVSKPHLSASFIYTLAKSILRVCMQTDLKIVACSGGVFQNSILVRMLSKMLEEHEIVLKINRKLSTNDENISFGQVMYHQHCKN